LFGSPLSRWQIIESEASCDADAAAQCVNGKRRLHPDLNAKKCPQCGGQIVPDDDYVVAKIKAGEKPPLWNPEDYDLLAYLDCGCVYDD